MAEKQMTLEERVTALEDLLKRVVETHIKIVDNVDKLLATLGVSNYGGWRH